MPPPWLHSQSITALPEHCEPSSAFLTQISSVLHICLPTPLALVSSTLGAVSILSWLFAQLPQIYKNYKIQSTSGLSAWFLVEWCLGDSGNLIGAIFTNQAGWQIIIAAYYVFVDIVLVYQYFWYTHLKPRTRALYSYYVPVNDNGDGHGDSWESAVPPQTTASRPPSPLRPMSQSEPKDAPGQGDQLSSMPQSSPSFNSNEKRGSSSRTVLRASPSGSGGPLTSPQTILLVSMLCATLANAASPTSGGTGPPPISPPPHESASQIAGRISSWVSTVMYLVSRIPQLYKNYRRQSTSGLSPLLFCAAFGGNLFYSTSLLTNPNAWSDLPPYGGGGWAGPNGSDRLEWVGRAIPFFLGAAGVLILDGAMGVQFLLYAEHDEDDEVLKPTASGRGRQRWKKVTGWIAGWVPSPSITRKTAEEEEEASPLLAHSQDRYGGV